METLSDLTRYDWFHSIDDTTVYVHYMNSDMFNLIPNHLKVHYAISKDLNKSRYVVDLGRFHDDNEE